MLNFKTLTVEACRFRILIFTMATAKLTNLMLTLSGKCTDLQKQNYLYVLYKHEHTNSVGSVLYTNVDTSVMVASHNCNF